MSILNRLRAAKAEHEERHRASGFGIVLADHLMYLNAGHWDGLVEGKTFFLGRPYLSVLQSHGPRNVESRFALIYRDTLPVAALHAQFVQVTGDQLTRQKPLRILSERLLVGGDLLSTGQHGVAFAPGEDPALLWPAIAEAMYRLRRGGKLSGQADHVMMKDFDGSEMGADVLRRFDYRPLKTEPNMVMEIPAAWKTYDDYLASLTSKYRKSLKEINTRIAEDGISLEICRDLGPIEKKVHGLYVQVHDQADFRLFTLPSGFLPAMAKQCGDRFKCIVLKKGDDILAFVTTISDGETMVGYFIGFDREVNRTTPLYFRLLNAVVQEAVESGSKRLSLGRTALEPKARIGAKPVPTTVWVRHRLPVINIMTKRLVGLLPHDEPPDRSPFK